MIFFRNSWWSRSLLSFQRLVFCQECVASGYAVYITTLIHFSSFSFFFALRTSRLSLSLLLICTWDELRSSISSIDADYEDVVERIDTYVFYVYLYVLSFSSMCFSASYVSVWAEKIYIQYINFIFFILKDELLIKYILHSILNLLLNKNICHVRCYIS